MVLRMATCMPASGVTERSRVHLGLVTETWPPEINGVSMTLSRLVRGLRNRGHRVSIVRPRQRHEALREQANGDELLRPGVPIPFYRSMRMGFPGSPPLRRRWRRDRPDIVHIATEGPLGHGALAAARAESIPVSSSFHTNFHEYIAIYGFSWLTRLLESGLRRFHNKTRVTLVPSPGMRDRLEARGFERCRLLERGVDTGLFDPAKRSELVRRDWGLAPRQLTLLCVGRLAKEKNLQLAVRALHAVRKVAADARLVLVGAGPIRDELAREQGVVLAGEFPPPQMGDKFASADLFLFPSLTETFGNVLTEAMASGLPTVSFDYAASSMHVEHGRTGLKVPPGDEEAFLAHAVRAASNAQLRRELGRHARTYAQSIAWDAVVDVFEGIVQGIVADHRKDAR